MFILALVLAIIVLLRFVGRVYPFDNHLSKIIWCMVFVIDVLYPMIAALAHHRDTISTSLFITFILVWLYALVSSAFAIKIIDTCSESNFWVLEPNDRRSTFILMLCCYIPAFIIIIGFGALLGVGY